MSGWRRLLAFGDGSGPAVARLFHRLLAAVLLVAWISLALQVRVLIGSRGLLPVAELVANPRLSAASFPSLFRFIPPTDTVLVAGCWLGAALALAALVGLAPRVLAGLQVVLYLSYTLACRDFYGFQWDNLLLESALLATLLPRDRPARLAHVLFKLLLFKLYFESGIAKWQSHLKDWHDGSAMTYYYETAPLPTWIAWYAHHLPVWWHHFESRATLVLELAVPFAFFGPRAARLSAAAVLTGFQLVNAATANYGFFVYLALCLHVFLLDDKDLRRPPPPAVRASPTWARAALAVFATVWLALSALEGVVAFADPHHDLARAARAVRRIVAPLRLTNTYHLFGHITRERNEVELRTSLDGTTFVAQPFRWKPGPPERAPRFAAPYQPRVDFLLWFYGLGYENEPPEYVVNLLRRVCHDPAAVDELFVAPLPRGAAAVQLAFPQYHFSSPAERAAGKWWTVSYAAQTGAIRCDELK